MPLPHLYIFHPHESRAPHLMGWLAEVQEVLRSDANWGGSELHRIPYDLQAGFNVGTEVDRVRRNPGPAIFIQKVQARLFNHFRDILSRTISIYSIDPATSDDIYAACEEARKAYDDGEPRIPLRELVAYLIIAKLARHDMWGGTALNKNFLWAHDLPKGGFPKDVCTDRDIMEAADALFNVGVRQKPADHSWRMSEPSVRRCAMCCRRKWRGQYC